MCFGTPCFSFLPPLRMANATHFEVQASSIVLGTEVKMNSEKFFWLNDLELLGEGPGKKIS